MDRDPRISGVDLTDPAVVAVMSARAYCVDDAARQAVRRIDDILTDDRRFPAWLRRELEVARYELVDKLALIEADPEWTPVPRDRPDLPGLRLVHARYDGESREDAYCSNARAVDDIEWRHVTEYCLPGRRDRSRVP